ncbi:MAG: monoheme cytochrome C [Flavobacteriaceae bacterium]|nr:monoheme cytochrome C [Flavobacteriaceae bacterium]
MDQHEDFRNSVKAIYNGFVVVFLFIGIVSIVVVYVLMNPNGELFGTNTSETYTAVKEIDEDLIENGIHVQTGLVEADGLMTVVHNCTSCHSAKLVIQNRMNAERWASTIDWMQRTQNLADLGANEEIIINYLVTNYPPQKVGRRRNLTNIDWYDLEN